MAKNGNEADHSGLLEKTMKALLLAQLSNMKQKQQIELLDRAGFGRSEIANLIGSTANAVGVRLAELRKKTRRTRKV